MKDLPTSPALRRLGWKAPDYIEKYADKFTAQITHPNYDIHNETDEYLAACWLWTGKVQADGQAFMWAEGRRIPIHRFAFMLWVGDVPDGHFARPLSCGTKTCTSPHHLELVTRRQIANPLSDQQANDIRQFFHEDGWSLARISRTFGISRWRASRIVDSSSRLSTGKNEIH